jgi:hypothetical protein
LHACSINGKSEAAVADAEGGERVDLVDVDIVTLHEGFAVDGLGVEGGCGQQQEYDGNMFMHVQLFIIMSPLRGFDFQW